MSEKTYRIKPLEWVDTTRFSDRDLGVRVYRARPLPDHEYAICFNASEPKMPGQSSWFLLSRPAIGFDTEEEVKAYVEKAWRDHITQALEEVKP